MTFSGRRLIDFHSPTLIEFTVGEGEKADDATFYNFLVLAARQMTEIIMF